MSELVQMWIQGVGRTTTESQWIVAELLVTADTFTPPGITPFPVETTHNAHVYITCALDTDVHVHTSSIRLLSYQFNLFCTLHKCIHYGNGSLKSSL